MKWYGITGGIASGKTTVSRVFRQMGIPVIDADEIAKTVIRSGTLGFESVVRNFGENIIDQSGEIDRQKLAGIVFSEKKELLKLESIVHPLVQEEVARRKSELEKKGTRLAFYDVPLLFEKKMQNLFDGVVLVYCDEEIQKERLRKRNHLSDSEIQQRLQAQIALSKKRDMADFVLENDGTVSELEDAVKNLVKNL